MRDELEKILESEYPEYAEMPIVTDINADENPRDDFWSNLSSKETYNINAKFLKQTGNPTYDYLTCWEPGRLDDKKESLFDYPTLYEFDVEWWEFQKKARYDSIEDCKKWMEQGSDHWTPERVSKAINDLNEEYKDGYEMYCQGDWFRLIENDTFLYSQIISAKWYIYYELENYVSDLQDEYLPYSLNEDDMDFQELLNCDDPTKKYKADGRELELESLQEKIRNYEGKELSNVIETFLSNFHYSGKVFRFDRGYDDENFDPFTDFIFWDEESLKNVRTTHFLKDFKDNQLDNKVLTTIVNDLKKIVKKDFIDFYNENKSRYI